MSTCRMLQSLVQKKHRHCSVPLPEHVLQWVGEICYYCFFVPVVPISFLLDVEVIAVRTVKLEFVSFVI